MSHKTFNEKKIGSFKSTNKYLSQLSVVYHFYICIFLLTTFFLWDSNLYQRPDICFFITVKDYWLYGLEIWTIQLLLYQTQHVFYSSHLVLPGTYNVSLIPRYVQKQSNVYAIVLNWPDAELQLGAPKTTAATTVSLLGYDGNFSFQERAGGGITIQIPPIPVNKMPCEWAWIFKLTALQ